MQTRRLQQQTMSLATSCNALVRNEPYMAKPTMRHVQTDRRVSKDPAWAGVVKQSHNSYTYQRPHQSKCVQSIVAKQNVVKKATNGLASIVGSNPKWTQSNATPPHTGPYIPKTKPRYLSHGGKQAKVVQKRYPIDGLIKKTFYSPGHASVSEEGQMQAEAYFKECRPWGGQPSISYASKSANCGTRYENERFWTK